MERFGSALSVKNGMELEEKDSIKTSKGSQIQLIFTDKTVITLGSESDFRVDEYLSDGNRPKAKFKFNQGTFKAITGRIGKSAPESFKLETKTATIGIRGTTIGGIVGVLPTPDTIFCFGGRIIVGSLLTGGVVNLPAGTITTVPLNAPPASPRKITPQDIIQFNEGLGVPGSLGTSGSLSDGLQSGSNEFQSMNFDATLSSPLSTFQGIQTFEPAAATTAQQINLQNVQNIDLQQSVSPNYDPTHQP
ncbi:FecR family protein [Sulfurimonas sp.]|uniref:FecR family protein n=1 Tax=Sulfurimonas sp. TaxID=2022749 RepID=UPI0025FC56C4|nr:FecR family protein [Sulfurimonas sp.]MDD5156681.1 FecR family protein [Sulfurimonas sp.]